MPSQPAAATLAGSAQHAAAGLFRVLVADDNPLSRELMCDQLALLGFEVDGVDDGRKAVTMARTGRYGLLVLDVNMPQLDGVGVMHELKDLTSIGALGVIVTTADRLGTRRVELAHEGVGVYLTKPVRIDRLGAAIERLLAA